jgi:hypothetical protein
MIFCNWGKRRHDGHHAMAYKLEQEECDMKPCFTRVVVQSQLAFESAA